jgi:zinc protease
MSRTVRWLRRRVPAALSLVLLACAHAKPPEGAPAPAAGTTVAAAASDDAGAGQELPGEQVLDTQPKIGPLPSFDAPVPEDLKLPNGLRVLVVTRKAAPIEAIELIIRRGGSSDPADRPGLASLTAAMLEAGSAGKTQAEIAQTADALGASLRASAGRDATVLSVSGLNLRAGEMIALLADVALRPNFDGDEWKHVKAQRLAGLRAQRAEPGTGAALAFAAAVYGENPLARPVSGTPDSVAALELADVKDFFRSFSPAEAALVVSGSLSKEELLPMLAAAFGKWAPPPAPRVRMGRMTELPPPPPPAGSRPRLVLVDYPGKPQSVVQAGLPAVPRSSPDVLALRLLDAVLGGSFTSRLNQNLREQHGYSYGAGSSFAFGAGPGPFTAGASVKTEVTAAALSEMLGEVRRAVEEPLTAEELSKGKALLAFDLVSTLEHAEAAAGAAAAIFLYGLPLDEFRTFVPRLKALDPSAVQAAGRRAIDPNALTVVIAGDVNKVTPQLAKSGLDLGPPQLRDPGGKLIGRLRLKPESRKNKPPARLFGIGPRSQSVSPRTRSSSDSRARTTRKPAPSTSTSAGRGRALYWLAIDMPYAPAVRRTIKSLLSRRGSRLRLPSTSVLSQTGPTTSTSSVVRRGRATGSMAWYAP